MTYYSTVELTDFNRCRIKYEFGVTIHVMKSCYVMAGNAIQSPVGDRHQKGKIRLVRKMVESINKHQKNIVNGGFGKPTNGDYLCASCLGKERSQCTGKPSVSIDIDEQESLDLQFLTHNGVGEGEFSNGS